MDAEQNITPTVEAIAKAIRRRSVVSFTYQQQQMLAEPIVLGLLKEHNKPALRCYKSYPPLPSDKKENWYLCLLEDITNLKVTPVRSKNFRHGCKTLHGDMSEVIECSSDYIDAKL